MKAYHFLKDNMCGGYGKEPPWKVGETRSVEGKLEMCSWGYHASPSWLAALNYAQGGMACIVELSGDILKDENKSVAQTRKLIEARDSSKTLREFACQCAERALKRAKITDERSWEAVKVARLYSKGKATLRELAAAGDAAWAAARDAAGDAARAAAGDDAWAAARAAAWAAAGDDAWAAARAAAWAAARAAARDAAGAAAWAAAWDAEVAWQKRTLNKIMRQLFKEEK